MLVEKSDDRVLAEIDLEALHFDLDLLRRKAFLDLNPPELGDNMRRRPLMTVGIPVARSIDRHPLVLKSDISSSTQDIV